MSVLPLEEPSLRVRSVSGPPSTRDGIIDRNFRRLAYASAWLVLFLLAFILWSIGDKAWVAMRRFGIHFLTSTTWDVAKQQFGILPQMWGTLYSSLLALLIGGFFGVVMAIFLTQDFLPARLALVFRTTVELLAAIPSVVYGLWGLFIVVPAMRPAANWLFCFSGPALMLVRMTAELPSIVTLPETFPLLMIEPLVEGARCLIISPLTFPFPITLTCRGTLEKDSGELVSTPS